MTLPSRQTFAIVLDAAARASHSLGRWWEAEERWKLAQKFDGSAAAVWRQLSELYVEQRSYEAALEQLDGYLRLIPDDVQARHRQALLKQASRSGLTREEQRANHAELVGMIRENAEKLDQIVKFHTDALDRLPTSGGWLRKSSAHSKETQRSSTPAPSIDSTICSCKERNYRR